MEKWNVTQNGMSLEMECHLKWNVTQNGIFFAFLKVSLVTTKTLLKRLNRQD